MVAILGFGGGIVGLIALICAIWIIYDVLAVNRKLKKEYKIIWIICAIIVPINIIAAIIYYLIEKK